MLVVPLAAVPAQELTVALGGQRCGLRIYQRRNYARNRAPPAGPVTFGLQVDAAPPLLFIDVRVDDALIVGGVPCLRAVRIVRNDYLGFAGDLAFFDMQGTADPEAAGLGGRWFLGWLEPGIDL